MAASEPRSPIVRLFSLIWSLFVFVYRAAIVLVVVLFIFGWFVGRKGTHPTVEANQPLAVLPSGELVDQIADDRSRSLLRQLSEAKPPQTRVRDVVDALQRGAKDARVPFAVLKLDDMDDAGLPQLQEVAAAIQAFRAAGKPVYAFGESYDQKQYFLAAQADEISLDPLGGVSLEGFSVYTNYFKDALDKLGVQINVFRVGEFKSAVEPFERNDMSPEARAANEAWLGDLWSIYGKTVAEARKLQPTAVDDYVRNYAAGLKRSGGDSAKLALDSGLVTRLETQAQFRKRMVEKVGATRDRSTFRQIGLDDYLAATDPATLPVGSSKLAMVVVQGQIVDGEGDESSAGGDTIADLLDEARRDDEVSAVLLRVNSPGGSVTASEKIRRAVQALRDDEKPVVVSMSTLAASGGYWVSMAADRIFAEPTTITGSIGIFGLVPTFVEPLAKLGVHTDGLGTTPLAGALRGDRPLSADVKTIFQTEIERGYKNFIEGVSAGRGIPVEQVDSIARGRVWSGRAAKDLGLVDELGGLGEATEALAKLAGLDAGRWQLHELQPERNYFGQMIARLIGRGSLGHSEIGQLLLNSLPAGSRVAGQLAGITPALRMLDSSRGAYAYCFCEPTLGPVAPR